MQVTKSILFTILVIFNLAAASPAIDRLTEQAKALRIQTTLPQQEEIARQTALLANAMSQLIDYGEQEKLETAVELLLKNEMDLDNFTIINSKDTDFFGKSKDEVFFVKSQDGSLRYVVKAFRNPETRAGRLLPELSAMALLRELPEGTFLPVSPLAVGKCRSNETNYGLLVESVAPGKRIDQYTLEEKLEKVAHMFQVIGGHFAKLHRADQPLQGTFPEEERLQLLKKYEALLNPKTLAQLEGKLDLNALKKEVDRVLNEVDSLTLVRSFQHESAHVRNLFFDEERDQVIFIDVAKMHLSIDFEGNPLSDNACDLVRLQESLSHQMVGTLTEKQIKNFVQALYDGYEAYGGHADRRLINFYTLTSKLSRLKSSGKFDEIQDPIEKEKHRLTFENNLKFLQELLQNR
jgi:hypothetical protein